MSQQVWQRTATDSSRDSQRYFWRHSFVNFASTLGRITTAITARFTCPACSDSSVDSCTATGPKV